MKKALFLCVILFSIAIKCDDSVRLKTSCPDGYFNTQICIDCQQNCSCSSFGGCDAIQCEKDEVQIKAEDNTLSCLPCPTGCALCEYDSGQFKCTECDACDTSKEPNCDSKTYYQLINGICVELDEYGSSKLDQSEEPFDVQDTTDITINQNTFKCKLYDPKTSLCESCPDEAFLNEYNQCEQCVEECGICNSRGTCTQCKDGYYWVPDQKAITQTSQITLQLLITATQSISGNYEYGAGCCKKCEDELATKCDITGQKSLACKVMTYLDNNKCNVCVDQCQKCTSSSNCQQCNDGYFIDGSKCHFCFGNDANTKSCQKCDTGKLTSCDTCMPGYQNLNNKCLICSNSIEGCSKCSAASNAVTCDVCQDSYFRLKNNTTGLFSCVSCNLPDQGGDSKALYCYKDDESLNENVTITQCITGYSLTTVQGSKKLICKENINNCNIMIDEGQQCKDCYPNSNYVLVGTVCLLCNLDGCLKCSSFSNNQLGCIACKNGDQTPNLQNNPNYALVGDSHKCQQCGTNCSKCNADNTCTECVFGAMLNNGKCGKCNIANCLTCDTATLGICSKCFDGYFLQSDDNSIKQCYQCPAGCSACDSDGSTCSKCLTGFFLNGKGCNEGVINCAQYNSDGTCNKCNYAYDLSNGQCHPCIDFKGGYVCGSNAGSSCFELRLQSIWLILSVLILGLYN